VEKEKTDEVEVAKEENQERKEKEKAEEISCNMIFCP
jgi:hypothetical protein